MHSNTTNANVTQPTLSFHGHLDYPDRERETSVSGGDRRITLITIVPTSRGVSSPACTTVIMPKGYNTKGGSNGHFNHDDPWSAFLLFSIPCHLNCPLNMPPLMTACFGTSKHWLHWCPPNLTIGWFCVCVYIFIYIERDRWAYIIMD